MRHAQSHNNACQDNDRIRSDGRMADPELTDIGKQCGSSSGVPVYWPK